MSSSQLGRVLRRERERAVTAAVAAFARELDRYGTFPREALDGDISRIARHNIELFSAALAAGRLPSPDELGTVRLSAAARAEERVPLQQIAGAYLIGARVTLATVYADEELGGTVPVETVAFVLDYLTAALGAAVDGYHEELRVIQQAAQSVRERVLDSLLTGVLPSAGAESVGYELPARFLVLAVTIGPSADERSGDVDTTMAAHRKLRRVRASLDRHCGDGHLTAIGPEGGVVLVPTTAGADPGGLVARLAEDAGAPVLAGVAEEEPALVGEAARLAADVLEVARILGRPPGAYAVADVLVEYQITRPGPACDALAARLAALDPHPELLATLRVYLDSGGNRRRSARVQGVHPNTIDNRIRRVGTLTDADLSDPLDCSRLRAALIARDAIAHRRRSPGVTGGPVHHA